MDSRAKIQGNGWIITEMWRPSQAKQKPWRNRRKWEHIDYLKMQTSLCQMTQCVKRRVADRNQYEQMQKKKCNWPINTGQDTQLQEKSGEPHLHAPYWKQEVVNIRAGGAVRKGHLASTWWKDELLQFGRKGIWPVVHKKWTCPLTHIWESSRNKCYKGKNISRRLLIPVCGGDCCC